MCADLIPEGRLLMMAIYYSLNPQNPIQASLYVRDMDGGARGMGLRVKVPHAANNTKSRHDAVMVVVTSGSLSSS